MKRVYAMKNLDCASCAAKMERQIGKIAGVRSIRVQFLMQRMTLEAEDEVFDAVLEEAIRCCKKIEPDCRILSGGEAEE